VDDENSRVRAGRPYRPDIDGLRAVAVLAVVFFHYGVPGFSGGFVGVDVFFVISGCLITGVIQARLEEGGFSLLAFYEGRVRRIFPALFAMLAAVAIAGSIALFPDALVRLGDSLGPAAAFAANFHFKGDYFDINANAKPLLHTWSLAVEEQFYLVYPALLLLLARWSAPARFVALALLMAASFAAAVYWVQVDPIAAFYQLPLRLWELLLGAMLVVAPLPKRLPRVLREALALIGLGLIGWSIVTYTAQTPFPGLNALAPCLGAFLVIYASTDAPTAVGKALSLPPLVTIGLISYSLYLWHWPVFVIAAAYAFGSFGAAQTLLLIGLSFLLAFASWRFVELPFRTEKRLLSRPVLFACGALAIMLSAAVGQLFVLTNGLPGRYDPAIRTLLAAADDHDPRQSSCMTRSPGAAAAADLCVIGDAAKAPPSFILWGDSHADALMPAVDAAARGQGRAGYVASRSGCAPLLAVPRPDVPDCEAFNAAVLALARSPRISEVILVARWPIYTDPAPYGPTDLPIAVTPSRWARLPAARMSAIFAEGLAKTVQALRASGKTVVIVDDVPEVRWLVPQTLARSLLSGRAYDPGPTLAEVQQRQAVSLAVIDQLGRTSGVLIVDPRATLCDARDCRTADGIRPLYRDADHLTVEAARGLAPLFAPALIDARPSLRVD